jgi:hypothetical protein
VPESPQSESGKTFSGWYYGDGTKYTGGIITTATSLYAKWDDGAKYNGFGGKEIAILVSAILVAGLAVGGALLFTRQKKKTEKETN